MGRGGGAGGRHRGLFTGEYFYRVRQPRFGKESAAGQERGGHWRRARLGTARAAMSSMRRPVLAPGNMGPPTHLRVTMLIEALANPCRSVKRLSLQPGDRLRWIPNLLNGLAPWSAVCLREPGHGRQTWKPPVSQTS